MTNKYKKAISLSLTIILSLFVSPLIAIACECDADSKNTEEINPAIVYNEEDIE